MPTLRRATRYQAPALNTRPSGSSVRRTTLRPSRYLAVAYGGLRCPFTEERWQHFLGLDKSVSEGGRQIDYADEDPRIRELYEKELSISGLTCAMPPIAGQARP